MPDLAAKNAPAPEAAPSGHRNLFVGGDGAVGFAVHLDAVEGILLGQDLPAGRREVSLPGLFDAPSTPPVADRYARVLGLEEKAYVRLGAHVSALEIEAARLEPVPAILGTTAARWGWSGVVLLPEEEGTRALIVVDVLSLARIGAPRSAPPTVAVPTDRSEDRA